MIHFKINDTLFVEELLGRRSVFVRSEGKWTVFTNGFGAVAQSKKLDEAMEKAKTRLRYLIPIREGRLSSVVDVDFCARVKRHKEERHEGAEQA